MPRALFLSLLVAAFACEEAPSPLCSGEQLFGRPEASTGLTDAQCGPRCDCGGGFVAPLYTAEDAAQLLTYTLLDPPASPSTDPYATIATPRDDPAAVCAVRPAPERLLGYRLESFPSAPAAEQAGALVTHFGACGLCSSLQDLAVYMRYPDLTTPVRQCGLDHLGGAPEAHRACLARLGFTDACAGIWYDNTVHTRTVCALPCFALLDAPYHEPSGALNECLRCDEEASGAVFKAVAGRTRRNTGLASALCRPCSEVRPLLHDYEGLLR